MKREILMLIIGILIGAIIATGVFLVLDNNNTSSGGMDFSQGGMERGDMSDSDRDLNNIPDDIPSDIDASSEAEETT